MADKRLRNDEPPTDERATDKTKRSTKSDPAVEPSPRETKRTDADGREDRAMEDRAVTENREITDDERLDMFRQSFVQSALPNLPEIPGYHVCWLTTNNPRDSIHMRMRLGYEPLRPADVPGWEYATIKTGEYQGLVGVNEMLAFKLPMSLYQRYMQEAHHDAPNREQEKLVANYEALRNRAQAEGGDLLEFEGNEELRHTAPVPQFQ